MPNWFQKVKREFSTIVSPFKGRPILYVEIGCFEGDSAEWVAKNILTHPGARGIGIDDYAPDRKRGPAEIDAVKQLAIKRLAPYPRWSWRFEKSQDVLRRNSWGTRPIDLLYIDGSHNAHDVVLDFAYAWPHLKEGSVVVFDDYGIGARQTRDDGIPRVPVAVGAILSAFQLFVEPLATGPMQFSLRVKRQVVVGELLKETFQKAKVR